jgi:hypothetical protein
MYNTGNLCGFPVPGNSIMIKYTVKCRLHISLAEFDCEIEIEAESLLDAEKKAIAEPSVIRIYEVTASEQ